MSDISRDHLRDLRLKITGMQFFIFAFVFEMWLQSKGVPSASSEAAANLCISAAVLFMVWPHIRKSLKDQFRSFVEVVR